MKTSRIVILIGLIILGMVFTGYASDKKQSADQPEAAKQESRWDTAELGGPSAAEAKTQTRWDTADLGGPSATQAQTQSQIGAVVISVYGKDGNLIARWDASNLGGPSAARAQSQWDTADLGGPSAARAQSRWDTADLGGPSAARAQSRWDTADLGGPSAARAQSRWDTADLGGPSAARAQSRWDTADLGGPSAARAQSRWDTADLGGPSAARAQSRWDTADLGGPSAARAQSRWDTADLGGPSAAGAQSRWDTADLGGPSATRAQTQIQQGIWDKQYRVWKRGPRLQITNETYDRDRIGNGLLDIIGRDDVKFYFQDYKYVPVRLEWLQQYIQWWEEAKANFGISYGNDAFDCENFARLFKALADVSIIPMELKESKSLATATLLVYPKNAFGGIGPESGTHVLNLVGTDRGWVVVEPQTGAIVEFSKYPNLKYIIGIAFG